MGCANGNLGNIIVIAKTVINIIWIVGPIAAIVALTYHITMLMKNPEDKKAPKNTINSIIALVILFLIPTLVNVAVSLLDNDFSKCWESISTDTKINEKYNEIDTQNIKKRVYNTVDDFEKGSKTK